MCVNEQVCIISHTIQGSETSISRQDRCSYEPDSIHSSNLILSKDKLCKTVWNLKRSRKKGSQERQRALGSHGLIKSLFMGYYKHLFHLLADTQWKIRTRHNCSVSSSVESPGKAWNCPQQDTTSIQWQLTVSDWLIRICLEMHQ